MRTHVEFASGLQYGVDLARGIDISIRLSFDGAQPSAFGAARATDRPMALPNAVLDTKMGGSCNVRTVTLTPHCNGTHSESVRHITNEGPAIIDVLPTGIIGATLTTVAPEPAYATDEDYVPSKGEDDVLITRRSLAKLGEIEEKELVAAVIIRTLPNGEEKTTRDYALTPAPHFSIQAIEFLIELGVSHLLVDTPSVDRADDEGRMCAHHLWFGIQDGRHEFVDGPGAARTITEMIFVDDAVYDGPYLLQLQAAPFDSDAAPSRPVLFPLDPST